MYSKIQKASCPNYKKRLRAPESPSSRKVQWLQDETTLYWVAKNCLQVLSKNKRHIFHFHQHFIFFNLFYLFLPALGLHCHTRASSSCGKGGATLSCGAWALGTQASVDVAPGLSSCGSQTLELRLSSCGTRGLAALWHVGSSQTRARTHVPCLGRQILNYCATREVPPSTLLKTYSPFCSTTFCHSSGNFIIPSYQNFLSF